MNVELHFGDGNDQQSFIIPLRVHVAFSGSMQLDDAEKVVALLKEVIDRRPPHCGAFLHAQTLEEYHVVDGRHVPID